MSSADDKWHFFFQNFFQNLLEFDIFIVIFGFNMKNAFPWINKPSIGPVVLKISTKILRKFSKNFGLLYTCAASNQYEKY